MAFRTQKISQMTPKGANLEGSDLLEVSTLEGGSYVTRSITGQEIIDAASGSGVTSVTGTAPIASTGGSTPDISISQAGAAEDGYLTQGDWNAFNNKQDALSSGVNIKTINSTSVLGSGNIAVQPTLVSGTNIKTVNSTSLLGSGDVAVQPTLVSGTNIKTIEGQSLLGSGDINLTASDVGLGNVDNTSDLNKPISTATQTALNAKQNTLTLTTTGTSGAATLVGSTLNIPQYGGGGASGIQGVHALIKPSTGQIIAPIIGGTVISSGFNAANRLTAIPFIPANTFTSSNLYLNVTNFGTGAIARILIYSDLNGIPNTKLYESATLDCGSNGIKTATTSFTFTAGVTYWICSHSSLGNGFTTFQAASLLAFNVISPTTANVSYIYTFAVGSAPTTLGTPTANANAVPAVFITSA